ncbi:hypothetical protein B7463_g530, partial [Scytalidium lignicola]
MDSKGQQAKHGNSRHPPASRVSFKVAGEEMTCTVLPVECFDVDVDIDIDSDAGSHSSGTVGCSTERLLPPLNATEAGLLDGFSAISSALLSCFVHVRIAISGGKATKDNERPQPGHEGTLVLRPSTLLDSSRLHRGVALDPDLEHALGPAPTSNY